DVSREDIDSIFPLLSEVVNGDRGLLLEEENRVFNQRIVPDVLLDAFKEKFTQLFALSEKLPSAVRKGADEQLLICTKALYKDFGELKYSPGLIAAYNATISSLMKMYEKLVIGTLASSESEEM